MRFKVLLRIFHLIFIALALAPGARAAELEEFYRGVRAMGMGNAFTAVSDDADAIFYNPAGMALHRGYDVQLINPKLDVGTDDMTIVTDIAGAGGSVTGATISKIFGKHLYGNAGAFPSLVFPGFTLGMYYNVQTHIVAHNLTFPTVDASYTKDVGLISGFAHEFRGLSKHHYLRLGMDVKMLSRQGFHQIVPLSSLVIANKSYISTLNSAAAKGIGVGAGFQYEIPLSRTSEFTLGSAYQDIGDTQFGNAQQERRPPPIKNNLSVGVAYDIHSSHGAQLGRGFRLSADLRHLTQSGLDPRLRAHVGAEVMLGPVSFQAGLNQDSLCLGAKAQIWMLEVEAVTYGVEDQALAFMDRERRYMLQMTMSFDLMGKTKGRPSDEDRKKHPRNYQ